MLNKDIEKLYYGIQSLRARSDFRAPARVSFTLVRGSRSLLPLVQDCEEARKVVLEELGTPAENGQYQVTEENLGKVKDEFNSIENIDVPVELPRLKLEDIEKLDLSIQEAEALEILLEEDG